MRRRNLHVGAVAFELLRRRRRKNNHPRQLRARLLVLPIARVDAPRSERRNRPRGVPHDTGRSDDDVVRGRELHGVLELRSGRQELRIRAQSPERRLISGRRAGRVDATLVRDLLERRSFADVNESRRGVAKVTKALSLPVCPSTRSTCGGCGPSPPTSSRMATSRRTSPGPSAATFVIIAIIVVVINFIAIAIFAKTTSFRMIP